MATLNTIELYLIVPAEATNEVTNPSFELATTGYTAVGAGVSISRSSTYQRRGVYSLEVTPATNVESGVYFGTVNEVSGTAKTFSADVRGVAGQAMTLSIRDTSGNSLSSTSFTANGYWQRIKVTRTGNASTTRRLYITRNAVASTAKFYIDGLYYSSVDGTYLDGDMRGFVRGATDYRWLGAPHASQSWRSGATRSGGTMLRIKDYASILTVLGLGMATVTNIALPLPLDYSSYQATRVDDREIILNLAFTGNVGEIQAKRAAIINAIRPDATPTRQPLVIRYQGVDTVGNDSSEPIDIKAHYVDGLEDQPGSDPVEFAPVRFNSFLPFLSKAAESGAVLGYQTSVTNFSNIGYRDVDGTWKAMGTGATGGRVAAFAIGPDGSVYAGGAFTSMGGVAVTGYIARWDGISWNSLPTGLNGAVNALAIGPDGNLYVGGEFTATLGGTTLNRIGKWDGANWTALGTGVSGVAYVDSLRFSPDGSLYAGGSFITIGGVTTNGIAKWNGSTWSALGAGVAGAGTPYVLSIAIGQDGLLYAGGNFTTAGGVSANRIAKWDGSAWSALGGGMAGGISTTVVNALTFGPDGLLYAGGDFYTADGVTVNHIASWNGTKWSALGSGMNGAVLGITAGQDGLLYVVGEFTTAGGVSLPDRMTTWTNGTWIPVDIAITTSAATIVTLAFDRAGRMYIGGYWSVYTTTALSASVGVPNIGGARAYPIVTFTGPGTVYQLKNYTTGKSIYFNGLTLQAGETATLDLSPGAVSFTSSFRGNLASYLLAGSDFDWYLLGGNNNVSTYMLGTTAASGINMTWTDLYWSADGAKR